MQQNQAWKIIGPRVAGVLLGLATLAHAGNDGKTRELPGLGVQTQEQLDVWRAKLESKNESAGVFSSPQATATQQRTLFYTGKPYDADQSAYLFKYRAYDPSFARWTSSDPSGFPDGANNWVYCGNSSLNNVDSNGLKIQVIVEDIKKYNIITNYQSIDPSEIIVGGGAFRTSYGGYHESGGVDAYIRIQVGIEYSMWLATSFRAGTVMQYSYHSLGSDLRAGSPNETAIMGALIEYERGHADAFFQCVVNPFITYCNALPDVLNEAQITAARSKYLELRNSEYHDLLSAVLSNANYCVYMGKRYKTVYRDVSNQWWE